MRNIPRAAVKRPMKMLHAERFFSSSAKSCAGISSSSVSYLFFEKGRGRVSASPPQSLNQRGQRLALRRFAFCNGCFCFEHPDLGLGLTLRSLSSVFDLLQLRLNLGV